MTPHRKNLSIFQRSRSFACLLAVTLACSASFAEKPDWAGGGDKADKDSKKENKHGGKHEDRRDDGQYESGSDGKKSTKKEQKRQLKAGYYFGEPQRLAVSNYYGNEFRAGRCPPGLAKKNNGCMPPGQARKWSVGQQLPRDVVYYSVPQSVVIQLGAPPPSHKYVRVAADILLIAVGTNMVIDAIQDLGRL